MNSETRELRYYMIKLHVQERGLGITRDVKGWKDWLNSQDTGFSHLSTHVVKDSLIRTEKEGILSSRMIARGWYRCLVFRQVVVK